MIPKFKTYLEESVWGDLRKKSLGQEERQEDNLDKLSMKEFMDYLKSIYVPNNHLTNILYEESHIENPEDQVTGEIIKFPVMHINGWRQNIELNYNSIKKKCTLITVSMSLFKKNPDLVEKLKKKYVVGETFGTIKPKDGDVNYRFFINVIDDILANVKNPLMNKVANESVWGEIRKKSLGQEERVEDSLDMLDMYGLFDYIMGHYSFTTPSHQRPYMSIGFIQLPVFIYNKYKLAHITLIYKNETNYEIKNIQIDVSVNNCKDLVEKLKQNFIIDDNGGFGLFKIYSKDGELKKEKQTNRDFLQILDAVIEYSDKPVVHKKEN